MTFQITDIPRLLPELMLLALALLVLGTDVLERWGTDAQSQLERGKAAGQLTVIGLGFVFIVALVQSKFLFTVPEPAPETNPVLFYLITLGRNLQAGGPGGEGTLHREEGAEHDIGPAGQAASRSWARSPPIP